MTGVVAIRQPCAMCKGWGSVAVTYRVPKAPPPPFGTYSTAVGWSVTMQHCLSCWDDETERLRWINRSHQLARR